jgi:transposase-like protein
MTTKRRHFSGDQKAAVLKRYLVEKAALSDLCGEYGIQPNQVYQWQATLFENAPSVEVPPFSVPGVTRVSMGLRFQGFVWRPSSSRRTG